jgi:hypothetical protein
VTATLPLVRRIIPARATARLRTPRGKWPYCQPCFRTIRPPCVLHVLPFWAVNRMTRAVTSRRIFLSPLEQISHETSRIATAQRKRRSVRRRFAPHMGICYATSRKCIEEGTIASQRYLWIRVNSARQVGRGKIVPFALEVPKISTFRALWATEVLQVSGRKFSSVPL